MGCVVRGVVGCVIGGIQGCDPSCSSLQFFFLSSKGHRCVDGVCNIWDIRGQ